MWLISSGVEHVMKERGARYIMSFTHMSHFKNAICFCEIWLMLINTCTNLVKKENSNTTLPTYDKVDQNRCGATVPHAKDKWELR